MTEHVTLDSENRQVLWPPQDSPVFLIQDSIRNLVMVKGPTQKELRRNHGCLWKEHLNHNLKWSVDCTTGKEITELVSTATLMKLIPRQTATYVRYSNSRTMKETIGLADEFWGVSGMDVEGYYRERSVYQLMKAAQNGQPRHSGEQISSPKQID